MRESLVRNRLIRRASQVFPPSARGAMKRRLMPVRWGNLRRTTPFSYGLGLDRGKPIDRVYIEEFLSGHSDDVRGEVLEVGDPRYTHRFGGDRVTGSHVVDINVENPQATVIADLGETGSLPTGRFDCFLLVQTLLLVRNVETALDNAWRSLVPGGVLLVSVPMTSGLIPGVGVAGDYWRFTPAGMRELVARSMPQAEPEIASYGNVLSSVAFLLGLAAEELREKELQAHDPLFPLVVCARVKKPRSDLEE